MWLLGSLKALQKFGIFANTKKNICKFLHWYAEMHLTPKREKKTAPLGTPPVKTSSSIERDWGPWFSCWNLTLSMEGGA